MVQSADMMDGEVLPVDGLSDPGLPCSAGAIILPRRKTAPRWSPRGMVDKGVEMMFYDESKGDPQFSHYPWFDSTPAR
jgi:hypothetical protein